MLAQSLSRLSQATPSTSSTTKKKHTKKVKAAATTTTTASSSTELPLAKAEVAPVIDPKLLSLFADADTKAESRYSTLKTEFKQPSAKAIARERELAKKPTKRSRHEDDDEEEGDQDRGASRVKRQKTAQGSRHKHESKGKYNIDDDEEIDSILAQDGGDNDFSDNQDDDEDDHGDDDEDGDGDGDGDDDDAGEPKEEGDADTEQDAGGEKVPKRRTAKEQATRNRRTVFVGNLPIGTTEKDLKKHFKKYGKVESARIRSIPIGKQTISKKVSYFTQNFHPMRDAYNGFVVFVAKADAISACAENGKLFNGHHLRVDIAANSTKTLDARRTVFVGNVAFHAKDEDLWEHFGLVGPIQSVRVVRDRLTQVGKGFAYVCFKQTAAAKNALGLDQSMLHERPIRVSECMNENKYAAKRNNKAKLSGPALRMVQSARTFQGKTATPKDAAIMKRAKKAPKPAAGGKRKPQKPRS